MINVNNVILSFTSHGERIGKIDNIFKSHVELADQLGIRVCFSCQDDSIKYLTQYQKHLLRTGKIEFLHVGKDNGSNTKWTLCRQAHPESTMIVVDDDWIYDIEGIRSLLEMHERYPNDIVCRAFRTIPWIGKELPLYEVKPLYSYKKTVTAHIRVNRIKDSVSEEEMVIPVGTAYPEHFLGVLYPPYFPKVKPDTIPIECLKDDDVFIGAMASLEGRHLVFAGRDRISLDMDMALPNSLWERSRMVNGKGTFGALKSVAKCFSNSFECDFLGEVYVLTCKKYPKRRESIRREMDRLGIRYEEQYDNESFMPKVGQIHKRLNRCHLAKYLALKRFLETAAERLTIIEDDVRFLRNLQEVSDAIRTIPSDFGACRLSWAPSPYIRKEMEEASPMNVALIDKNMSKEGSFWVKCPWASTDGCTIITRSVAERFMKHLSNLLVDESINHTIDNSDDALCRICMETGKPLYAYKPLVCIQVSQNDCESGKSDTEKFLKPVFYHVPGVVRHKECYGIEQKNKSNISFLHRIDNKRLYYNW